MSWHYLTEHNDEWHDDDWYDGEDDDLEFHDEAIFSWGEYPGTVPALSMLLPSMPLPFQASAGNWIYDLDDDWDDWKGTLVFSQTAPGNKTVLGKAEDYIEVVFDFPIAALQDVALQSERHLASGTHLFLKTPYGEYSLKGVDIVSFADGTYALDTYEGGKTWQAWTLHHFFLGQQPSAQALTTWTVKAQQAASFTALCHEFLQEYAPGATLPEIVGTLYKIVKGVAPDAATVASVLDELEDLGLDTDAEILAFAAENFADTTPILGQPILLDPAFL